MSLLTPPSTLNFQTTYATGGGVSAAGTNPDYYESGYLVWTINSSITTFNGVGYTLTMASTESNVKTLTISIDGSGLGPTPPSEAGTTQRIILVYLPIRDYGPGSTFLTSATINSGGTNYTVGDFVYLTATGGTQVSGAGVSVTTISGGVVTGIAISMSGSFTSNPTAFSQSSTTGNGTGLTLSSPSFTTPFGIQVIDSYSQTHPNIGTIPVGNQTSHISFNVINVDPLVTTTSSTIEFDLSSWLPGPYMWPNNDVANTFTVMYKVYGSGSPYTNITGQTGVVTITGLASNTSYEILLWYVGPSSGLMGQVASFSATTAASLPNVPIDLEAIAANSSSITMSWEPASSGPAATSFTLQYRTNPSGSWTQITGITNTYYTVTGLLPVTWYDFEIEAVNGAGGSGFSSEVVASTTSLSQDGPIPVFPTLPEGFPVKVSPNMDTIIGTTKSLREMRVAQRDVPLWDFEILFEELLDQTQNQSPYTPFAGDEQYEYLVENWLMMYGQTNVFCFDAPWDDSRSSQQIGIGDGSTYIFTVYRTWGQSGASINEPIGDINTVTEVQVNGVTVPFSNYYIDRNKIYFIDASNTTHPPGNDLSITMTFSFYYLCRFVEDEQDFEEFAKNRWRVSSLKFQSTYWP